MNKIKISFFVAFIALASFTIIQELTSGIIKNNMDLQVKPGDNFANYVNGNWLKTAQIPADKSSIGVFDNLYDQSQKDVKAIIEEAAKGKNSIGSEEQKIGDYYASFIDRKEREARGVSPLQQEMKSIDDITTYSDLASYFGKANRLGIAAPFQFMVFPDLKDPKKYSLLSWQSGLGLPEREYYLATDAKMIGIRKKYQAHIETMFNLAGLKNAAESAAKIIELETTLASKQMTKEDTRDVEKLYNKFTIEDLKKVMPDFDWMAMLKSARYDDQSSVVIAQVDYTKNLNDIIKNTPIATWRTYLKWGLLNKSASVLTTVLDNQHFEFYSKILYGTEKQEEDWKRAVSMVNGGLGEIVGKVYVKKHFSPEAKKRMMVMVKNLLNAYAQNIKKLDWMSEDTKKEALKKVGKFMIKIGYPDTWKDYSMLKITKNDLYGNQLRATEFEYNRNLEKLNKPVDRTEWNMKPQTVNAYYNPVLNEIVFPAAILQPPFFDLNADDAINYGSIGAVIGHEIGHGFDNIGSAFDGDGVMKNWWTPADLTAFKDKTKVLVEQYNGFKVFPDLNVNGVFTLGENIGDLGGLSIAIEAYKTSLNNKKAPNIDGFTGLQRVFIGFAQGLCNKQREEALRGQIANDPHAPANFRINGVVRNIPEFYEAFAVKPTDSLYLSPDKRVKIW